ncbi:uncharacterized protein [Narcine bancroftii]|uniref:uncharacterized protein n=1 Tax=Narcine bancroftii TaxID=1343680 RepID=UPI0038315816
MTECVEPIKCLTKMKTNLILCQTFIHSFYSQTPSPFWVLNLLSFTVLPQALRSQPPSASRGPTTLSLAGPRPPSASRVPDPPSASWVLDPREPRGARPPQPHGSPPQPRGPRPPSASPGPNAPQPRGSPTDLSLACGKDQQHGGPQGSLSRELWPPLHGISSPPPRAPGWSPLEPPLS